MRLLFLSALAVFLLQNSALATETINIQFNRPQNAPYFIGAPERNIDSDEYDTIVLKLKSNRGGTARLFWASSYDAQLNEPKSLWFFLAKSNDFKEYIFNVKSQNQNWLGFIPQLAVLPESGPAGVEILGGLAQTGNFTTNLKSGWQEFWGPRGRTVIGSTINLISSSSVFGQAINLYVYWLIALSFFVLMFINYYRLLKKPGPALNLLSQAYAASLKQIFIFASVLWFLLALNADFNYFNIFKENYTKYFGKTIEEKRAISYGRDYYNFLAFARQRLPQAAADFGLISAQYAPELQARIYLIPHILVDPKKANPLYLLIYKPGQNQKPAAANYSLFAKFNAAAYILKRK